MHVVSVQDAYDFSPVLCIAYRGLTVATGIGCVAQEPCFNLQLGVGGKYMLLFAHRQ
jgi:hypothetical protein